MTTSFRAPLLLFGHLTLLAAAAISSLALSGCAGIVAPTGVSAEPAAITGAVHGGQQPIIASTVSLISPGTSGYGSNGTVLATTTTDAHGNFTLPNPIGCPATSNPANSLVYLLATGGNAGAGPNAFIAEAAVLGPCSSLNSSSYFSISEVTTVAAAYTLAPFATVSAGSTAIGTSSTNLQGLANAFGPASNLANLATGYAHTTADLTGIVPPTSELNTLADILSTCVNQGTSISVPNGCATLFTNTTPAGGVAPTDTFQAAINIAKNPALNNATLFGLVTASGPYQPTLAAAPGDFTVALGYNGGAITTANGTICVVIDAAGDAWVTTGYPNTSTHVLTEITPAGAYPGGAAVSATSGFGSSVLSSPIGLAIDTTGNFVVANNSGNDVLKLNPSGILLSTFISSSLGGPNGITVDALGNTWVANFSSSADVTTEVTPTFGAAAHNSIVTAYGGVDVAAGPLAIWQTNHTSTLVTRIDLTTFVVTNAQLNDTTAGIDIDHNNSAWVADTSTGNVFKITDAGVITGPARGYAYPNGYVQSIAIDGLGNVFGGGYLGSTTLQGALVEYNNAGTFIAQANGFYASNVIANVPQIDGIAIDGSGNVWIAGSNVGTTLPLYVAEVIGVAAPVVTPRITAVVNSTLGTRP